MSDFEINKAAAASILSVSVESRWLPAIIPDYCNNPSDAWPIIVENGIAPLVEDYTLNVEDWVWVVSAPRKPLGSGRIARRHKKPLRAAMIVYLMMQEEL